MENHRQAGWIVILNGAPRSGKSSIAADIQERFDGPWMNLGVDAYVHHITPPRYRPGIGPATRRRKDPFPAPVLAWQQAVHTPGIYDVEVDTSVLSPEACADAIRRRLAIGPPPTALERLRAVGFSPP